MDLISVIVPVYKVEDFLERCVNTIRRQTYRNLEIILVDDGSPDNCGSMCDAYAAEDSRIRVIHQKNGGLSNARNSGIDSAKGAYLAFVDSDDFITEDFIEVLYHACKDTDSDIAQCKYEYVSGNEITKAKIPGEIKELTGKKMLLGMYEHEGAYNVVAWNKLYKRELFWEIRYPDGRIHEDEATTYRLFYIAKKAAFVQRYLYGYYTASPSITRDSFNLKRLDWAWALEERIRFYENKGETELLCLTLKAYADGVIDLYYKCAEFIPNSGTEQKELKEKLKAAALKLRSCKNVPVRTRIGYQIFACSPKWYQKLLAKGI